MPRALRASMPHSLRALRALAPCVPRTLPSFVSHLLYVLNAFVLDVTLVPCVLRALSANINFSLLCFHASSGILKIYFQLLSCFDKFTTGKIRMVYKSSIEMTVSINQQYDLVRLFSKKYLCY